jgi:hypothetical protein
MANIQKTGYPEPSQAFAVKNVNYSLLIIHLAPPPPPLYTA